MATEFGNPGKRLDNPCLVICGHNRNQYLFFICFRHRVQHRLQLVQTHTALAINRDDVCFWTGGQYRIMFNRAGDNMREVTQNQIICLGTAAGENHIMYRYVHCRAKLLPGGIHPGACHTAKMMNRRWVGRHICKACYGLNCLRAQRRGCIVIKIDRRHAIHLKPPLFALGMMLFLHAILNITIWHIFRCGWLFYALLIACQPIQPCPQNFQLGK